MFMEVPFIFHDVRMLRSSARRPPLHEVRPLNVGGGTNFKVISCFSLTHCPVSSIPRLWLRLTRFQIGNVETSVGVYPVEFVQFC